MKESKWDGNITREKKEIYWRNNKKSAPIFPLQILIFGDVESWTQWASKFTLNERKKKTKMKMIALKFYYNYKRYSYTFTHDIEYLEWSKKTIYTHNPYILESWKFVPTFKHIFFSPLEQIVFFSWNYFFKNELRKTKKKMRKKRQFS